MLVAVMPACQMDVGNNSLPGLGVVSDFDPDSQFHHPVCRNIVEGRNVE